MLTFSLSFNANADMGRIYVSNEAVKVSEDAQKAIILHTLEEEVLILGTDLKADKKTGIMRFKEDIFVDVSKGLPSVRDKEWEYPEKLSGHSAAVLQLIEMPSLLARLMVVLKLGRLYT